MFYTDIINKQVQKIEEEKTKVIKEKENIQMEAEEKSEITETPLQSGCMHILPFFDTVIMYVCI